MPFRPRSSAASVVSAPLACLVSAAVLVAGAPVAGAAPPTPAPPATAGSPAAAADATATLATASARRALVRLAEGSDAADVTARLEAAGLRVRVRETGGGWAVVRGAATDRVRAALAAPAVPEPGRATAAATPAGGPVAEVTEDHVRTTAVVPPQRRPDDPVAAEQHHLDLARLPVAWSRSTGSRDVVIAVLDTGVDLDHPDLAGALLPGADCTTDVGCRAGGDAGLDPGAVDGSSSGHGTAVAGVAAARTGNGLGVAGAAWDASVLPVRVMGPDGDGYDSWIIAGIRWAVDAGADVVNLSLSGPGDNPALADAVRYALERDVVVVGATGNDDSTVPTYPAAYPGVLAVGAAGPDGRRAPFSNRGPWVRLVAPGTHVVTTAASPGPVGTYSREGLDGSSFAAPIVAGTAALLRAAHPDWDRGRVADALTASALDRGALGPDPEHGAGLLDAGTALGAGSPYHPFADAAALVAQQYRDLLLREPDPGGLAFWASRIVAGDAGPGGVTADLLDAPEAQQRTAGIVRLYRAYFRRLPDQGGLDHWSRVGQPLAATSRFFAASPEFLATYGALDDAGYVDRVYRNVLGRPPDAAGRDHWLGALASGRIDRGGVMVAFAESPENVAATAPAVRVALAHTGLLRRAPSDTEHRRGVDGLHAGRSLADLVTALLESEEYARRFAG